MKKLNIDGDFKNLIPPLSEEEFKQLEENLLEEGCRDALVVWKDTILDGHNRYEICTKHNIPFATKEAMVENKQEAIIWIIRNQFGRRNLPLIERTKLAYKLKETIRLQAKRNLKTSTGGKNPRPCVIRRNPVIHTKHELAKLAGTSPATIDRYGYVMKHGDEETKRQMNSGDITITAAKKIVLSQKKPTTPKQQPRVTTAEIEKIYHNMKKPLSAAPDNGKEENNNIDNPIISELNITLKRFKADIQKYTFMGYQETSNGVKVLLKELSQSLLLIDEKIKEI